MTDVIEPRSEFVRVLQERGFIHQASDLAAIDEKAASGELVGYIGFDCTAPSLHVGSLVQIMMLHWLQQTGGKPIALMGGGTTMVGDPSGKDETRKLLTVAEIEANKAGIRKAFSRFIRFGEGKTDAVMPDNAEWLTKLNYLEFLRDIGRHFSVNRMLSMDSVKNRWERDQELSFLEFNYMCCQAYDFVELNSRYGCTLQMGGSDQWGNIVTGVDLGRRLGTPQLLALTSPLITTASGAKMGKTVAGAVWLDAAMRSPYDYWQFWRNTEDADVGRFLRLFTLLPLADIAYLERHSGAEINEAKKALADAATALLHGSEAAEAASATARKTFETAHARHRPADGGRARRRIRRRLWRAARVPARQAGRLVGRGPPADSRRRPAHQRRRGREREGDDRTRRAARRRPGQAVVGEEEARAAAGGVGARGSERRARAARRDSFPVS